MTRPTDIAVGRGVKIYRAPEYSREDARCIAVDNATGIINARTVKSPKTHRNIPHRDDSVDASPAYWTELPVEYEPGSDGH